FAQHSRALRGRQGAACTHALAERLTLDVRHHEKHELADLVDMMDRHDVRMAELCPHLRLAQELLAQFRPRRGEHARQHLDRHRQREPQFAREVDDPHPAAPELALERVAPRHRLLERDELRVGRRRRANRRGHFGLRQARRLRWTRCAPVHPTSASAMSRPPLRTRNHLPRTALSRGTIRESAESFSPFTLTPPCSTSFRPALRESSKAVSSTSSTLSSAAFAYRTLGISAASVAYTSSAIAPTSIFLSKITRETSAATRAASAPCSSVVIAVASVRCAARSCGAFACAASSASISARDMKVNMRRYRPTSASSALIQNW